MHFKDDIAVMNISRCIPVVGKIRYSHQVYIILHFIAFCWSPFLTVVTSRWNYCFYLRTAFSLQHNSLNTYLLLNKLAKIKGLNCLSPSILSFLLFSAVKNIGFIYFKNYVSQYANFGEISLRWLPLT